MKQLSEELCCLSIITDTEVVVHELTEWGEFKALKAYVCNNHVVQKTIIITIAQASLDKTLVVSNYIENILGAGKAIVTGDKDCTAIFMYAKGKKGKFFNIHSLRKETLLDTKFPENQVASLHLKRAFEEEVYIPVYVFQGTLDVVTKKVMTVYNKSKLL